MMSTYQQKLRMLRMSIPYGDQAEVRKLINKLAPTMLPMEMAMIIYQSILVNNIGLIEYCLDRVYESRLLQHCSWEGTNLIHLTIESGTVEAAEVMLSRNVNKINDIDGKGRNALLIAYKTNSYEKMHLLLRYGAEFYPPRTYMRYVNDRPLPGITSSFLIYCLARESCEKRFVNPDDIQALKFFHPEMYRMFLDSKAEWKSLSQTKFVNKITYRDLLEYPVQKFLQISRSVSFRKQEEKDVSDLFPTYSATVDLVLDQIRERRNEWEEKEKTLDNITFESIPTPILEQISYYLCLE